MAYIGVVLAAMYLWVGWKVAMSSRAAGMQIYTLPLRPLFMGFILGLSVILAAVGPFVLFGASWPAVPVLMTIVVVAVAETVIYYWEPFVYLVNLLNGVEDQKYTLTW